MSGLWGLGRKDIVRKLFPLAGVVALFLFLAPSTAFGQTATDYDYARVQGLVSGCTSQLSAANGVDNCRTEQEGGVVTTCSVTIRGSGANAFYAQTIENCSITFSSDSSRIRAEYRPFPSGEREAFEVHEVEWFNAEGQSCTRDVGGGMDIGAIRSACEFSDEERDKLTATAPAESCDPTNIGCHLAKLPGLIFVALAFVFLMISGVILTIVGTVFNWVVLRSVFQFGTYFGTSEGMLLAWSILRDIANIALLFAFIFVGVLLILNVEGGGHGHGGGISAKKAIPRLIIFAVLLNFSLFATQFVIDVSNALSANFAGLAVEECSTTTTQPGDAGDPIQECANNGIAGRVLQVSGLASIFDTETADAETFMQNLNRPYSYAVSLIMLAIFVIVTALVLLAGAIMLIIRVVVLTFLMITSPIGFAALAVPKLEKIGSLWWSKLISNAFFAPVYLLLIFISIKLADGLMDGDATLANALTGNQGATVAGNMQVVMVFAVVIGFMIASLIVASKMGAMGASFATKTAAGMTLGTVGFVGRRTVGRASTYAASRIRGSSLGETALGKRLAGVADYGSKASFSLRNVSSGGLSKLGLDVGKANKTASHGYHGIEEMAVKERVDYAKSLKGPRNETDEEMRARIKREEEEKLGAQNAADLNITNATDAVAAASANRDAVEADRANNEREVASLRAAATQNPQNVELQRNLIEAERKLSQDTAKLTQADKALVDATNALAASNKEKQKADAMAVNRDRSKVTGKQRQLNYAQELHDEKRLGISLAGHANHEAYEQIKNYAGKSDIERALDEMNKRMKDTRDATQNPLPRPPIGGGDH